MPANVSTRQCQIQTAIAEELENHALFSDCLILHAGNHKGVILTANGLQNNSDMCLRTTEGGQS